jgi:MPBQ/MSBQ methyltransferase
MKFESVLGWLLLSSACAFAPHKTVSSRNNSSTEISMGLKTEAFKKVSKMGTPAAAAAVAGAAVLGTVGVKYVLDRPSRKYEDGSVAREYDAWTQDGILEYYWGEHIHLGYYTKEE